MPLLWRSKLMKRNSSSNWSKKRKRSLPRKNSLNRQSQSRVQTYPKAITIFTMATHSTKCQTTKMICLRANPCQIIWCKMNLPDTPTDFTTTRSSTKIATWLRRQLSGQNKRNSLSLEALVRIRRRSIMPSRNWLKLVPIKLMLSKDLSNISRRT